MAFEFEWKKPRLSHDIDQNGLPVGLHVENWTPRPTPQKETMIGSYCRLEPFDLDKHYEGLFQAFYRDQDARNWTYLPYGPFKTVDEFCLWCQQECVGDDPLFYTIIDQTTGQQTGLASYLRISPEPGSIEVGHIHFSPLMQGTRMATESMYLMMRHVFDELGYRRYEWKCNALNEPSCRAADRLGFQFEGIFRQATLSKNRNRDTAWFAILDEDWPQLKKGFDLWLAEDNFDPDGQQIRSLKKYINSV